MDANGSEAEVDEAALERLRSLVGDCINKHLLRSAIFFADKLVSLSDGAAEDVFLLAQAYVYNGEEARALALLRAESLTVASPRFAHLTAVCLVAASAWDDALALLGEEPEALLQGVAATNDAVSTAAACCLLRGRVYAALENRPSAAHCFKAALSHDPLCYEAFEALAGGQMLTPGDEVELLGALRWPAGCAWVGSLYSLQAAARSPQSDVPAALVALGQRCEEAGLGAEAGAALAANGDVQSFAAEWRLARGDAAGAYAATSAALIRDPQRAAALPTHLSAAAQLGKSNELFRRGHELVKADPGSGIAWYAVGCYYSCVGQPPAARRALARCTAQAPSFAPGWMAYGHAFAASDETEQALAAYRTAARLFQGAPAPLLWMGVEYARAANWQLARQFLTAARDACAGDGAPHHELGCVWLRCGDAAKAETHFRAALQLAPSPLCAAWEPALLGLGHALRKQRRWAEAAEAYERSLALLPRSAATLAALAFTHQVAGDRARAIELYHHALGLRPDDSFAQEMLEVALAEAAAVPRGRMSGVR